MESRRLNYIPQQLHRMRLHLHMVMHFVNSLHLHFMNKVAFSDWEGLYTGISNARGIDDVIKLHGDFLHSIRAHLLLGDVSVWLFSGPADLMPWLARSCYVVPAGAAEFEVRTPRDCKFADEGL